MASFSKSLSLFFFLMVFSSLQIEASGRYFFSKVSPSDVNYSAKDPILSYEQETEPAPEVAAQAQKVAVGQPKEPSFTRNQYGEYGLLGSAKDTSATIGTSSNNENDQKSSNSGDNFIYNMETGSNGNGDDNIWDEIKQQGFSDTRSLQNGRYNNVDDLRNGNNYRFNAYDAERRGSIGNEGYGGETGKQNEFDTLEEYEKYLQRRGYLP